MKFQENLVSMGNHTLRTYVPLSCQLVIFARGNTDPYILYARITT